MGPVVEMVSIEAGAIRLAADGTSTTNLTINLKDTNQQPLFGQSIRLTTDNGKVSIAKDNGDGTYTATYTAGNIGGTANITVVTSNGKFATAKVTLLTTQVELSAEKTRLPASSDASTQLGVSVKDSSGRLLPGQSLQLSTDIGSVISLIDNGDGTYNARYKASSTVGLATISAYIN